MIDKHYIVKQADAASQCPKPYEFKHQSAAEEHAQQLAAKHGHTYVVYEAVAVVQRQLPPVSVVRL